VLSGTDRPSWHYATSREVAGSIPEFSEVFNVLNSSSRTLALGRLSLDQKWYCESPGGWGGGNAQATGM
jgi:hypothetical protein